MKTNAEIRAAAWASARAPKWFGRFLAVIAVVALASLAASSLLSLVSERLGIQSMMDFQARRLEMALNSGLDYGFPSRTAGYRMFLAWLFETFINHIFAGIGTLAFSTVLLAAVDGRGERWLRDSLAGFVRPFGVFWLTLRIAIQMALWLVATSIPVSTVMATLGFPPSAQIAVSTHAALVVLAVLFYRYQLAWFFKADRPDWGAGACIFASVRTMMGRKRALFALDCSFWKPFAVALALLLASSSLYVFVAAGLAGGWATAAIVFAVALFSAAVTLTIFAFWVLSLAHAHFYRALLAESRHTP